MMTKSIGLLFIAGAILSCTAQSTTTESAPALSRVAEPDCQQAISTLEINQCASVELDAAEQQLHRYLQKSLEQHRGDAQLEAAIKQSQTAWQHYAKAHCDAIYTQWRDGSIRGVMAITCKTQLTHERTHQLWSAYLTAMDDSPPLLPEPAQ